MECAAESDAEEAEEAAAPDEIREMGMRILRLRGATKLIAQGDAEAWQWLSGALPPVFALGVYGHTGAEADETAWWAGDEGSGEWREEHLQGQLWMTLALAK